MKAAIIVLATALSIGGANAQTAGPAANPTTDPHDYPTSARVDYVIGCMATNGQTQEAMERCSCSIDHIAQTIPYNSFVQLETIRRMQDQPGERALLFRSVGWVKDLQERFRLAQVEADLECFPQ
ncbi:hypothetical protein [Skermanella pratensis]|uniref:hypothetical protein n=1 Tax=Skermanella pratensis TaxID=2233999 RepID=UPI00130106F8|nr:hypothetical protein [Skermanella pratensis]